jgi:hypothetical protein
MVLPRCLNLSNAYFDKGVTFTFPSGFTLNPLERCVVVASQTAFETRYGTGFKIAGEFEGSLDNGGETLRIMDAAGEEVLEFVYDDDWFSSAGGTIPQPRHARLGSNVQLRMKPRRLGAEQRSEWIACSAGR